MCGVEFMAESRSGDLNPRPAPYQGAGKDSDGFSAFPGVPPGFSLERFSADQVKIYPSQAFPCRGVGVGNNSA